MIQLINELYENSKLADEKLRKIIESNEYDEELFQKADSIRRKHYGTDVYIRGLIELSNYCKNNCYYCGIRRENKNTQRYRLDEQQIISCCKQGYQLGFRTFVLQSGEDDYFTDEKICSIISGIKSAHPDCAVTLSLGEKNHDSYKSFYNAGADRYLLRHETADINHYRQLHPKHMSLEKRKECLKSLKEIGYQVGSGFMVGSPYQTTEHIINDLRFLQQIQPHMIGIGPYIPHKDTPFATFKAGELQICLRIIAIVRLMFPKALIPATTALGSITSNGRELGLLAGANVIMPNLTPIQVRKLYELYNNKISTEEEAAEYQIGLKKGIKAIGYNIVTHIGHAK